MTTNEREFCIGDQLTFRCTSRESAYSWIVTGFLNGTIGNGRVLTGANEMDGEFMLSASGINNDRMSTLQVTVFEGLVGERTVTCREGGTTDGGQSVNITVLGESFSHSTVFIDNSYSTYNYIILGIVVVMLAEMVVT